MEAEGTRRRGFAGLPLEQRQAIAAMGGKAAHVQGKGHEFTTEEAAAAGHIGGVKVSQDRDHMATIGRKGGNAAAKT
jgi:hypothetical protein